MTTQPIESIDNFDYLYNKAAELGIAKLPRLLTTVFGTCENKPSYDDVKNLSTDGYLQLTEGLMKIITEAEEIAARTSRSTGTLTR